MTTPPPEGSLARLMQALRDGEAMWGRGTEEYARRRENQRRLAQAYGRKRRAVAEFN
jgi:hypothetical protein